MSTLVRIITLSICLTLSGLSALANAGEAKLKKVGQYNVQLSFVFLNQPTPQTPFARQGWFESGGVGTANIEIDNVKYTGTAEFTSSLFLANYSPDSPSGILDTKNISPSIIKMELSPKNSNESVIILLQQYDAFYGDDVCLGSLFLPEGATQNETCGENSISRPWVGGYAMDEQGNPTNQLAIDLGKKLYRVLYYGRLIKQKIDGNGNLDITVELYKIDPMQK